MAESANTPLVAANSAVTSRARALLRICHGDDGIVVVPGDQEMRMSDQLLERIEAKLDRVITIQEGHTAKLDEHSRRFDQVDAGFGQVETRLDGIDTRLDGIDTRLEGIDGRLDGIDTRLEGIDGRLDGIDTRLTTAELSLENTVPQAIKQIAEGHALLQQQMDRGFADIKKHIDTRLGPLEEAVRQHSAELKRLT